MYLFINVAKRRYVCVSFSIQLSILLVENPRGSVAIVDGKSRLITGVRYELHMQSKLIKA